MAGAIIISAGSAVSMGSPAFDHILEATRAQFAPSEKAIMEALYRPYDHEGMMFLSLDDATPEVLQAFARATTSAMAASAASGSDWPQTLWKELCERLSSDARGKNA